MEPEDSSLCLQKHATETYLETAGSSQYPHNLFLYKLF